MRALIERDSPEHPTLALLADDERQVGRWEMPNGDELLTDYSVMEYAEMLLIDQGWRLVGDWEWTDVAGEYAATVERKPLIHI